MPAITPSRLCFPAFIPSRPNTRASKRQSRIILEVQVQQTVRLDLTLQVGQVSDSVEISAQAVLLQSENATAGTVIENKAVTELPLNGRSYLSLVALAANANTLSPSSGQAGSRQGGDRAAQSISVAGQRIMFDYFTLDGVTNTDPNFLSPISCCPPLMPSRSSRCKPASIPPSSAMKPRRST